MADSSLILERVFRAATSGISRPFWRHISSSNLSIENGSRTSATPSIATVSCFHSSMITDPGEAIRGELRRTKVRRVACGSSRCECVCTFFIYINTPKLKTYLYFFYFLMFLEFLVFCKVKTYFWIFDFNYSPPKFVHREEYEQI